MFYEGNTGLHLTRHRAYDGGTGRWTSRDPYEENGSPSANLYPYGDNNPVSNTDRMGLKTTIIIVSSPWFGIWPSGPSTGIHAGIHIDNGGKPILYDPGGSYNPLDSNGDPIRGSDGQFHGKDAALLPYEQFEMGDKYNVTEYVFNTTDEEERLIANNIDNISDPGPGACSLAVGTAIDGVGPFKGIGSFFPGALGEQLAKLPGVSITVKRPVATR